jgi:hypothetical protein
VSRGNDCTLSRVVHIAQNIAQKREAHGITVALSALELYEGGKGILRYLISYDPRTIFEDAPEPEIEMRDGSSRHYRWSLDGYSGGDGETEGTLQTFDLPDSGEFEIRVVRLVRTEPPEGDISEVHAGPWEFHLSF